MKLNVGDKIFYQKGNIFYVDIVSDVVSTKEGALYELVYNNSWCVEENELLDETDERVQYYLCTSKDTTVKLSDIRSWLNRNALDYYESDGWSQFRHEDMIRDLCKSMLYEQNVKNT